MICCCIQKRDYGATIQKINEDNSDSCCLDKMQKICLDYFKERNLKSCQCDLNKDICEAFPEIIRINFMENKPDLSSFSIKGTAFVPGRRIVINLVGTFKGNKFRPSHIMMLNF